MQGLINVKELTTDVLSAKVIEMVQELQSRVNGESAATSTETVEEIIEHDGLKLKRVDREAKEGDYVRTSVEVGNLRRNTIYGPVRSDGDKPVVNNDIYVYWHERTPSTVEVFEVIDVQAENLPFPKVVEEKPKLTANQQRALIIQESKRFITSKVKDGIVKIGKKDYKIYFHRKGKTISCILNDLETGYTTFVNKANCHPHDVFNEHIGQAIALGGIIGTPKKIFLKAVQPTVAVGQKVKNDGLTFTVKKMIDNPNEKHYPGEAFKTNDGDGWLASSQVTIIEDTNAQYEVITNANQ